MSLHRTYVWPYNKNSASAKALAEAMGILRVKSEGSVLKGASDLYIINFGSGGSYFPAFLKGSTIINDPQKVLNAVDKVKFFSIADETYGLHTPEWTTSSAKAKAWLNKGITVLARTQTEAKDGEGLVVMNKVTDHVSAPLYTQFLPSVYEYRVYVVNGAVVAAVKKVQGDSVKSQTIRTESNGWLFSYVATYNVPGVVKQQATLAVKACGLDFGGVDIIYDNSTAYVLEVNTAPWMGESIASAVGTALQSLLISRGAKLTSQVPAEEPAPVVSKPITPTADLSKKLSFKASYKAVEGGWGIKAGTVHSEMLTAPTWSAAAAQAADKAPKGWTLLQVEAA